jgi:hypothetical protein
MAKEKIEIKEIQATDKGFRVSGTVGSEAPIDFVATTFQWGSKMLMKVDDEFMDRGTRIAVGHAAKKAIRSAGLVLPEAVLKRPRKPKAEPVIEVPKEDFTGKSVKDLRELCKSRGIKGHSRDGITRAGLVTLLEA